MSSGSELTKEVVMLSPGQQCVIQTHVNFSTEAYEALQKMAQTRGTTMSHVLTAAIAKLKWALELKGAGDQLLIQRDGVIEEVII